MKSMKVGLIGTGYIGLVHLEILRRLAGIEVLAVADTNRELAAAAANKLNIPKVYPGADELIADREIDVVHNCAPNVVHFEINRRAILAGKEVLSEKPLSLNSRESAARSQK